MAVQITPVLRKTGYECCVKQTLVRAPHSFPTLYRFECSEHGFYPSTFDGTEIDKNTVRTGRWRGRTRGLGGLGNSRAWTAEEEAEVLEHRGTDHDIGLRIRRSAQAVQHRRSQLLGRVPR
jgi:hypothetical protein